MLNHIQQPEYRQLIVELLTIVSTILARNPELTFNQPLDLKQLVIDAAHMYTKDHNIQDEDVSHLFAVPCMQSMGYLARAVVNNVLKGGQLMSDNESCNIS